MMNNFISGDVKSGFYLIYCSINISLNRNSRLNLKRLTFNFMENTRLDVVLGNSSKLEQILLV